LSRASPTEAGQSKIEKEGGIMIQLKVNGKDYKVDVADDVPLLWVIRDHLNLTGTKFSCGIGECGSCTVHINGKAERSCTITAAEAQGKEITTIEGLPETHPVKRAWVEEQVVQCGYCQPGMMMQVAALLAEDPDPEKVINSLDDFICRCGTHARVKKGVHTAVKIMEKEGKA
jgi:isoquinoline 1-oxidoreductase alpha subunit